MATLLQYTERGYPSGTLSCLASNMESYINNAKPYYATIKRGKLYVRLWTYDKIEKEYEFHDYIEVTTASVMVRDTMDKHIVQVSLGGDQWYCSPARDYNLNLQPK